MAGNNEYGATKEGIATFKATAAQLDSGLSDIKTKTTSMKSFASSYGETLGPHKKELEAALNQIAGSVNKCIQPASNVSAKLKTVAKGYAEVVNASPFGKSGN